jgi:hypothetical protein
VWLPLRHVPFEMAGYTDMMKRLRSGASVAILRFKLDPVST